MMTFTLLFARVNTCTSHLKSHFVTYSHLSPSCYTFISSIDSYFVSKSVSEALSIPDQKDTMKEEMLALEQSGTWDLAVLPPGKKTVGYRWVYTVKLNPDEFFTLLKARLVTKGYSQAYGINYQDTFSPIATLISLQILISLVAILQ